jgi:site-specific DNA recombinase
MARRIPSASPKNTQRRAALYARVSSQMQVEGKSIDAQLAEMREYAKARSWKIAEEYVDAGVSATKMDRPQFQRMMADMEEGRFDIILVHELSRLSRSVYDAFDIFAQLGRHEVGFASVKEQQFDYTKSHDRLILHLLTLLHQYYIDILREHVAKSKRQRVRQGLHNASVAPYGYALSDSPDKPMTVAPQEAAGVRLIFERYASKRYSMQEVADELNRRGFRRRVHPRAISQSHTPPLRKDETQLEEEGLRKDPAMFTADAIRDILHNRFYIGEVAYGYRTKDPEIYQGQHEPIISKELWAEVRDALHTRRSQSRAYQSAYRIYLLSSIAYCSLCGTPLRSQATSNNRRYYREMSHKRGLSCPNRNIGANADLVEAQVGALFRHAQLPDDWQDEIDAYLGDEEAWLSVEQERQKVMKELENLKELYVKGFYDHLQNKEQIYWAEVRDYQERLKALPEMDPEAISEAADALINMNAVWNEAAMEEKREMLRYSLREVFLDVSEPRITSFCPHPEFIPLFQQIPFLQDIGGGCFTIRPTSKEEAAFLDITAWPEIRTVQGAWLAFPYLQHWEEQPDARTRITPTLSVELKKLRKLGLDEIHVLDLQREDYPPLQVDPRKWGEVLFRHAPDHGAPVDALSSLPDGELHLLHTPFPPLEPNAFEALVQEVTRVTTARGRWIFPTPAPRQMPVHWVHQAFPGLWQRRKNQLLDVMEISALLEKYGWRLNLKRARRTIYQAVTPKVAIDVAMRLGEVDLIDPATAKAFRKRLLEEQPTMLPSLFVLLNIRAEKRS